MFAENSENSSCSDMCSDDHQQRSSERGIVCLKCGRTRFEVTNTEPLPDGRIRRRKRCRHCGRRIVTFEVPPRMLGSLPVARSGERQPEGGDAGRDPA